MWIQPKIARNHCSTSISSNKLKRYETFSFHFISFHGSRCSLNRWYFNLWQIMLSWCQYEHVPPLLSRESKRSGGLDLSPICISCSLSIWWLGAVVQWNWSIWPCYCQSFSNLSNQHGWVTKSANWPTTLPWRALCCVVVICWIRHVCKLERFMTGAYYRTRSGWSWDQLFHLTDFGDRLKFCIRFLFFSSCCCVQVLCESSI